MQYFGYWNKWWISSSLLRPRTGQILSHLKIFSFLPASILSFTSVFLLGFFSSNIKIDRWCIAQAVFKVQLTPRIFFAKIIKLILWSNLAQKVFDLVKSSSFYARQSTSKCRHFGSRPNLTGHGSRAGCYVKSRTRWFCSSHIYLFWGERLRK